MEYGKVVTIPKEVDYCVFTNIDDADIPDWVRDSMVDVQMGEKTAGLYIKNDILYLSYDDDSKDDVVREGDVLVKVQENIEVFDKSAFDYSFGQGIHLEDVLLII